MQRYKSTQFTQFDKSCYQRGCVIALGQVTTRQISQFWNKISSYRMLQYKLFFLFLEFNSKNTLIDFKRNKQQWSTLWTHFLIFISCGAEILTLPGMFLARTSSLTAFNKSFSRLVQALSLRNIWTAVFDAFPRFPDPGVSFTLNLK